MSERTAVSVLATDPLSQAGIAAQLRGRPELWVLDANQVGHAQVAMLVAARPAEPVAGRDGDDPVHGPREPWRRAADRLQRG